MKNFRKLLVWGKAHELTLNIYQETSSFPKEELYGLISQMRRSAASIPSNIAAGCGRNSQAQLAHFLNIASGSASELEYQILLAKVLNLISEDIFKSLINRVVEIKRMLSSLLQKVSTDS